DGDVGSAAGRNVDLDLHRERPVGADLAGAAGEGDRFAVAVEAGVGPNQLAPDAVWCFDGEAYRAVDQRLVIGRHPDPDWDDGSVEGHTGIGAAPDDTGGGGVGLEHDRERHHAKDGQARAPQERLHDRVLHRPAGRPPRSGLAREYRLTDKKVMTSEWEHGEGTMVLA